MNKQIRIMTVDDSASMRQMVSFTLKVLGLIGMVMLYGNFIHEPAAVTEITVAVSPLKWLIQPLAIAVLSTDRAAVPSGSR